MPDPHLRASDVDRAAVAKTLGEHMSAGRLSVEEYDERLTRAYAARTYGELAELTADLPAIRPVAPTAATSSTPAPVGHGGFGPWGRGFQHASWRSWLATALVVMTIWLATSIAAGELLYFWPVWVIGPWGAVLLARAISGRRGEGPGRPDTGHGPGRLNA